MDPDAIDQPATPTVIASLDEYFQAFGPGPRWPLVTRADYAIVAEGASLWVRRVEVTDCSIDPTMPPGLVHVRPSGWFGLPVPRRVKRRIAVALNERKAINVDLHIF